MCAPWPLKRGGQHYSPGRAQCNLTRQSRPACLVCDRAEEKLLCQVVCALNHLRFSLVSRLACCAAVLHPASTVCRVPWQGKQSKGLASSTRARSAVLWPYRLCLRAMWRRICRGGGRHVRHVHCSGQGCRSCQPATLSTGSAMQLGHARTALLWHMSTSSSMNLRGPAAPCWHDVLPSSLLWQPAPSQRHNRWGSRMHVSGAHRGTCAKWKPCRSDLSCSESTTSKSNSTPAAARAMRSGSARPAGIGGGSAAVGMAAAAAAAESASRLLALLGWLSQAVGGLLLRPMRAEALARRNVPDQALATCL